MKFVFAGGRACDQRNEPLGCVTVQSWQTLMLSESAEAYDSLSGRFDGGSCRVQLVFAECD